MSILNRTGLISTSSSVGSSSTTSGIVEEIINHSCCYKLTNDVTIPSNISTNVDFNLRLLDTGIKRANGFFIPNSGLYSIYLLSRTRFANKYNNRYISLLVNDNEIVTECNGLSDGKVSDIIVNYIGFFNNGDKLNVKIYQNSTEPMTLLASSILTIKSN